MNEPQVLEREDDAFVTAHALLLWLSCATGPAGGREHISFQVDCRDALYALEGHLELVRHRPARWPEPDVVTPITEIPVALAEVEKHLAALITDSTDLESTLRATRSRDYVRAAAAEYAGRAG